MGESEVRMGKDVREEATGPPMPKDWVPTRPQVWWALEVWEVRVPPMLQAWRALDV